jgi:hypothetical protein
MKRRKPLDEQLCAAKEAGATHMYEIVRGRYIRLYRSSNDRWEARSLDGDVDGWQFTGSWREIASLPRPAELIRVSC